MLLQSKKITLKWNIFPNPSNGLFNLNLDSHNEINAHITITNFLGELVYKEDMRIREGEYNSKIDLKDRAIGIYLLSINTNKQSFKQKIVIQ